MKRIVIGNLKMNLTYDEMLEYVKYVNRFLKDDEHVVFCPSSPYLTIFTSKGYLTGSQNVYSEKKGSYTGEVSALQLKSLGVKYSLVGHSERRIVFGEDDVMINKKVKALIDSNLCPVVCVGESNEQRLLKKTTAVIKRQVLYALEGISNVKKIIIAYEPVWAIGTGLIPTLDEINNVIAYIKKIVKNKYDVDIRVLYGGSIDEKNIERLNTIENVDGFLVGGASIKAERFIKIINQVL